MQNLQFLKKARKKKYYNFKVSCLFYGAALLQSGFDSFLQQKCKIQKISILIYHYVPFQSRYVYTYINCNILRDLPPFKRKLQDMVFFSGICAKKCPRQYSSS